MILPIKVLGATHNPVVGVPDFQTTQWVNSFNNTYKFNIQYQFLMKLHFSKHLSFPVVFHARLGPILAPRQFPQVAAVAQEPQARHFHKMLRITG